MTECAKEVDIPEDERLTPTSDGEIRPLSYTSEGRKETEERKKVFFKDGEKESKGEDFVKGKKMDAMRHTLPRLQLTVPMPMKTGKVGLTFESGCFSTSWDENVLEV